MAIPPGVAFLAPRLPYLLLPPVVVYVAAKLLSSSVNIKLPSWVLIAAYILSWPITIVANVQWHQYRAKTKAAAAGAVLPPNVESNVPLGVDLVRQAARDWEAHYNGYRLMEWASQYGFTYNVRALLQDRVFTAEPDYIRRILATDFTNYEKGPEFHLQMKALLGTGVFNSDGEMWKFHRSMTRPFFSRDRISHFDVFERHADMVIKLIRERMQQGLSIDWQDLISRFTLDSATEFLFGKDLCSLSAGLPYPPSSHLQADEATQAALPNRFARSFLEAQEISSKRDRYTKAWPLVEFWKGRVDSHVKVMDEFIGPLLEEALAKKVTNPRRKADEELDDDTTLLEHLVGLTDDPQIIRDETLNILLAGRDTTALTLTMSVYMLSQHPDILHRLREEILTKVGTRRPSYDDIKDMKYLRAFMNEVLRLYPAVPFNVRTAINDTIWPAMTPEGKPYFITAGTRCLYSVSIMHRRPDLWGPDAAEFDPDRFLDERVSKYLTPNPFIFLPFNAGPRICLGQQFAYNEISFMLIRLLQQVTNIKLVQEKANPGAVPPPGWAKAKFTNGKDCVLIRSHLTMYVEGGTWMEMKTTSSEPEEVQA